MFRLVSLAARDKQVNAFFVASSEVSEALDFAAFCHVALRWQQSTGKCSTYNIQQHFQIFYEYLHITI